jgi:hypothetical protein
MDGAWTTETLANFYHTIGATTQKAAIFLLIPVGTSSPKNIIV